MSRERQPRLVPTTLRVVLTCWLLTALALTTAPAYAATQPTTLDVRLYVTPARANRGDVVSYEILVKNSGNARADRARVELPFSEHMQVIRTEFGSSTTWVSALGETELTVMFGRLNRGEERRAKLFFEVGPNAPDGLEVRVRATGRYEGDGSARFHSTYVTLTVGGQDTAPEPSVTVEPAVTPAGGRLVFQVRNYFPREQIFTWLNALGGSVLETNVASQADARGETSLTFDTRKLQPGEYSMVVFGNSSQITTVVPFTVQ